MAKVLAESRNQQLKVVTEENKIQKNFNCIIAKKNQTNNNKLATGLVTVWDYTKREFRTIDTRKVTSLQTKNKSYKLK
jgi:hypothetical protein